jgi:hypothetical protein
MLVFFLSEVLGILVSYLSVYYPCYQDLGRILVIFISYLVAEFGVNHGNWLTFL